jgi:hypothetical protein
MASDEITCPLTFNQLSVKFEYRILIFCECVIYYLTIQYPSSILWETHVFSLTKIAIMKLQYMLI